MNKWCKCGQQIWVEQCWNGHKYVPHFLVITKPTNTFHADELVISRIECCNGCGEHLKYENLLNES